MKEIGFRLRVFVTVLAATLVLGVGGFMALEGLSFVDALYFSVVTVATVGYGDIHPITPAGKLLAVGLIVAGVGSFLGVFANAAELLVARRQEKARRERLHMVIGLFMSEVGTDLLRFFSAADPDLQRIRADLALEQGWSDRDFALVCGRLAEHPYRVEAGRLDFEGLRRFLGEKRELLLRLLENPNLLEQESFTELLRAVFHLKEELLSRAEFGALPESDLAHMANDAKRAYPLLVRQWTEYLRYLKANYSYLYSLAVRTNPFDEAASPVVR
ncbi:MAG: two pore domain potassium channel family protein [Proteobacteria bacterium]|nr:two pore domain potassium channel family protein [Pseudomonadota bacterium]